MSGICSVHDHEVSDPECIMCRLDPYDIRIDTYQASSRTKSMRITHIPTGTMVSRSGDDVAYVPLHRLRLELMGELKQALEAANY